MKGIRIILIIVTIAFVFKLCFKTFYTVYLLLFPDTDYLYENHRYKKWSLLGHAARWSMKLTLLLLLIILIIYLLLNRRK